MNQNSRFFKYLSLLLVCFFLFACAERKAKSNYKTAEELYKGGSYKDAVAKYMEVIKYEKDIPEVEDSYYKLGIIYSKYLEDPTSAIFYLEQLVKRFPKTTKMADARKEIGYSYLYKLNKPDNAVQEFEFVEKTFPSYAYLDEVVYLKGQAFLAQKKFSEAEKSYTNFDVIYKNSKYVEEVEYKLGLIKLNLNKDKEAIEYLSKFIAKYPNTSYTALAKYDLGTAYENLGDNKKALEIYKSIGSDYPNQDALKNKIEKLEERLKKKSKTPVTRTPPSVKAARKKSLLNKQAKTPKTSKKVKQVKKKVEN